MDDEILRGIVYELHADYYTLVSVRLVTGEIRKVPKGSHVVYKLRQGSPVYKETFLNTDNGTKAAEKLANKIKGGIFKIQ